MLIGPETNPTNPTNPLPVAPVRLVDIWAHSKLNFPEAIRWGKASNPAARSLATSKQVHHWQGLLIYQVAFDQGKTSGIIEPCWHAGFSIAIHLDTSNSDRSVPFEAGTSISSEEKASSEPTEKQLSTSIAEHCNMGGTSTGAGCLKRSWNQKRLQNPQ